MILAALIAMFTMFEIFGRGSAKYKVTTLKVLHRVNGVIYLILFLYIAYHCIDFIISTKGELSSRSTFHSIFALTILVLFGVKISFVRMYKQFYGQARTLGLVIALTTFGMVGTSGIYYLLVSGFGKNEVQDTVISAQMEAPTETLLRKDELPKIELRIDPESIRRGRKLFKESCSFCHDPQSTKVVVGPGLMGVLKNPTLPASKRPSTPENIAEQLRSPIKDMPAFSNLEEDEVIDIISFLNTL
jgi:mono/diheme cytochrome c family protein